MHLGAVLGVFEQHVQRRQLDGSVILGRELRKVAVGNRIARRGHAAVGVGVFLRSGRERERQQEQRQNGYDSDFHRAWSDVFFLDECGESFQDDLQVEQRRKVPGIVNIQPLALLRGELARAAALFDLP